MNGEFEAAIDLNNIEGFQIQFTGDAREGTGVGELPGVARLGKEGGVVGTESRGPIQGRGLCAAVGGYS
ncbi:hypothetical protein [Cyanobium sp. ATX 6F1]|uniref:hypothetical protein n=1 Tax=Cyanobium sp. ATX 6F1 TaxID=2823702 RepID=UPI0020CDA91C|nr:hypothetical protein [Cyanobium sp. ATX 6F1]